MKSSELYGVCLFDDKRYPGDGYSCRPGASPTRISGIHDLSNDINWVTNLDFDAFRSNNLGHLKHICQSQFFRESIDSLIQDYGFGPEQVDHACQFMANHFNNTGIFGKTLLGIDPIRNKNNYRYAQYISGQLNIPILRQGSMGIHQQTADYICESATQANQAMMGSINGTESVHCYFPRLQYFSWLLNQPVPISNEWTLFPAKEGHVGYADGKIVNEKTLNFFKNKSLQDNLAFFFNIAVIKQNRDYSVFGTFGRGKKDSRDWVSLPELLNLCRYSYVKVKEIYSLPLGYLSDYIDFLPELKKIPDVSISAGLFMQNLAAAVMSPINKKETALGAYLRAYDRIGCFHAAEKLYTLGVIPASFSMGRIVTRVNVDQINHTKACMASVGLIPFAGY